jgi:hypothetical protein
MMFKVGLSRAEEVAMDEARLKPQPWKMIFAWHPIRLRDNVWIWWEYYESRETWRYDGCQVVFNGYEIRSTLRDDRTASEELKS